MVIKGKAKLIRPTCLLFSFNEIFPKRFESKISYSDKKMICCNIISKLEVPEQFLYKSKYYVVCFFFFIFYSYIQYNPFT